MMEERVRSLILKKNPNYVFELPQMTNALKAEMIKRESKRRAVVQIRRRKKKRTMMT
jgi:hypothetical protein